MNELIVPALLVINLAVLLVIVFLLVRRRDRREIEIKYFEYTENLIGALRESTLVTVKGQVHVDGMPIGGQFIVSETTVEKFDYEKLGKIRDEIALPLARLRFGALRVARGASAATALLGRVFKNRVSLPGAQKH